MIMSTNQKRKRVLTSSNIIMCICSRSIQSEEVHILAETGMPESVRVSLGTAMLLGLSPGYSECAPTTAYLMTYTKKKCTANCGFCPQARESSSRTDALSRVTWPLFDTRIVIEKIGVAAMNRPLERVCIQCLNYRAMIKDVEELVRRIRARTGLSISVSCQPQNLTNIRTLKAAGVTRLGIPLDAATEELFTRTKGTLARGPYDWATQFRLLREAVSVFGEGNVSTHLIVGLGETEKDMVKTLQECIDLGVLPGLFAFTPIAGTSMKTIDPPMLSTYRRIQIARSLMITGKASFEDFLFDERGGIVAFGVEKTTVLEIIRDGNALQTSGCPGCNRPYYNEKVSGPIYNYPRPLTKAEIQSVEEQFESYLR